MSLEEAKALKTWIVTGTPIYLHMPACNIMIISLAVFISSMNGN